MLTDTLTELNQADIIENLESQVIALQAECAMLRQRLEEQKQDSNNRLTVYDWIYDCSLV